MSSGTPVTETNLKDHLKLVASGKVREIYAIDDSTLLFVTTDRISAYDVIMNNPVPFKGMCLNQLSAHWFRLLKSMIPTLRTHFISIELPSTLQQSMSPQQLYELKWRCMQVERLKVFPIEAIVRGYIAGSAWSEYKLNGTVHGIPVSGPNGAKLQESEAFDKPIYTPSTKAELGAKDENIHPDRAAEIIGPHYAKQIEDLALTIYSKARDYALARGIIIADTKFEFGLDEKTDEVVLVDEVLTPDSSRFWPAESYELGKTQQSFDKQYLRDWLTANGLKGKEGVVVPDNVVKMTQVKYEQVAKKLSSR